jgi:ketosteroid isomerase-like protein
MSQENVEALQWLYDQFARGNFWAGREVFDPDIEWEWSSSMMDLVGGQRTTYRGLEGVESATRDWFEAWDLFWIEAEELIPVGDKVVVLVRRHGRAKGSTFDVETTAADVWTMRNGKAIRYKAYDDRPEALEASGLSEQDANSDAS